MAPTRAKAPNQDLRTPLVDWFRRYRRDLPWRRLSDPWAILVSEFMLQQTRVEAVIHYFERFMERYPSAAGFAAACESDVLTAWSGLGYYSRARNLWRSARLIAERGDFPRTYEEMRALPGVGAYTAAAVLSIAFNQPYAVLDGNVIRVLVRLTNDSSDVKSPAVKTRLLGLAQQILDPACPGDFNQALMELGATVCTPRGPSCPACPLSHCCLARAVGRERELPIKARPQARVEVHQVIPIIIRHGRILLTQRSPESPRLPGFWEAPDSVALPGIEWGVVLGTFSHSIVNNVFRFVVRYANLKRKPRGCRWWPLAQLSELPVTTATKKAVLYLKNDRSYRAYLEDPAKSSMATHL